MVGGLVEDQHVRRARRAVHQDRQRQPSTLATGEPFQRLLGVLAGEQEPPTQRPRLVRRQAGGALGSLHHALSRRAAGAQLLGVLGEVADGDVVAVESLPAPSGRRPASVSIRVVLPAPLGPTRRDVLAALQPQLSVVEQYERVTPVPRSLDLDAAVASSKITRPLRSGALKENSSVGRVARIALDALDLGELLDARLGLARLGCLGAEALDEALHALDLGLLLVNCLAQRHLPRGLLAPPRVPRSGKEA